MDSPIDKKILPEDSPIDKRILPDCCPIDKIILLVDSPIDKRILPDDSPIDSKNPTRGQSSTVDTVDFLLKFKFCFTVSCLFVKPIS